MNAEAAAERSTEDVASIAAELEVDRHTGLTAVEALRRLQVDGTNELRAATPVPSWRRALAQFQEPLVYLLLVAIVIALIAWVIEGRSGWPTDAIVVAVVVLLNGTLGYAQEAKAKNAVAALSRLTAATSSVLRGGQATRVPSAALVCGDVLLLSEGDAVGADARLFRSMSLRIQEASLTGESEAVLKDIATLPDRASLGDRINMVYKGTAVVQGTGRAIVTATGMSTELGRIAHLLDATASKPTPLQREVAQVGRMLGLAVLGIAAVVVTTILALSDIRSTGDVVPVLLLGVSLAVAAVPESLPAILSLVLALGVQRMVKQRAIVKTLASVETLGAASVIASDKTGTLTRAEMTIERVVTMSGHTRITGVGYGPGGSVAFEGSPVAEADWREEQILTLSGGSLAGDATLVQNGDGGWDIQGDPTEAAFLVAERKLGVTARRQRRFDRVGEVPFTSQRKLMSTLEVDHEHDDAIVLITKGAPGVLLERCGLARRGPAIVELDAAMRKGLLVQVDALADAALRTLAVAYRPLTAAERHQAGEGLEHDLIFVGIVGMIDPPRLEAAKAIGEAKRAGIRVIMITGDHPRTAARIAADLGIVDQQATVLTGAEIEAMDELRFAAAVRRTSVFARVAPAHKLRIVAALQADGEVVAMTGDGVNDAPALKAADIGIAMGITGTEVTKEAADMILADDNFATIVKAVNEGRNVFDNIRKFLRFLLSSNLGEVLTVFLGVVGAGVLGLKADGGAVTLPILAAQLLWINLVTDSGPALALGVDPPVGDMMARKPRRSDDRLIDRRMWVDMAGVGLVVAAATLLTIDLHLPGGLIDGPHDLATARTAGFSVLVFASLFVSLVARSDTASAFQQLFANRWLWAAIGVSALMQVAVVHLPFLNKAFGTVPLSMEQWMVCVAMASSVLWLSEGRKWLTRVWRRRSAPLASNDWSDR
ncbi:cation-translocating P-type ATPase [Roseateles noduli]|uniref:cation-translocating P-type ATPase n=1 Tax=Roseateles noduli TaxID=2052484 RepID=UPI003D646D32